MFNLIDIIVAIALGVAIGALITVMIFWKGYNDLVKRIENLENVAVEEDIPDEI